jgi:hypothetical protein
MLQMIANYQTNKTHVYCSLLDSTEAFDQVNYGKLFIELKQSGFPIVVTRFPLNIYTVQSACVSWNRVTSQAFSVSTGVYQ